MNKEIIWRNFWGCKEYVSELQKLRISINIPPEDAQAIEWMFNKSLAELMDATQALIDAIKKGMAE